MCCYLFRWRRRLSTRLRTQKTATTKITADSPLCLLDVAVRRGNNCAARRVHIAPLRTSDCRRRNSDADSCRCTSTIHHSDAFSASPTSAAAAAAEEVTAKSLFRSANVAVTFRLSNTWRAFVGRHICNIKLRHAPALRYFVISPVRPFIRPPERRHYICSCPLLLFARVLFSELADYLIRQRQ